MFFNQKSRVTKILLLVFACNFLIAQFANPKDALAIPLATSDSSYYVTNGQVNAIEPAGDGSVYIGGSFTYVGPYTGLGVPLSTSTGAAVATYPQVYSADSGSSKIYAAISDGRGGWYIGGDFDTVGGTTRNNVAHISSSGTIDSVFNPNADGSVFSLALSGPTLYVGGSFSTIGGQSRSGLAALNITDGSATSWDPNSTNGFGAGQVNSIVIDGTTIYVGGGFTRVGGESRKGIAALDASTGLATSWAPDATFFGLTGTVSAIVKSGNMVYVGGTFDTIGGQSRNGLGIIDATTGLATGCNPNVQYSTMAGTVYDLLIEGTNLYVAGSFDTVSSTSRTGLAAIDITTIGAGTCSLTGWNPSINTNGSVETLAYSSPYIYAGGGFTGAGGQSRSNLAAIDISTGLASTDFAASTDSTIYSLALDSGTIYVGGGFSSLGGKIRNRVARISSDGTVDETFNPNADSTVKSLELSGTTLYVGGLFSNMGGSARAGLASVDASTGALNTFNPSLTSSMGSAQVIALQASDGILYAGGIFSAAGGQARTGFAAFNTTTGGLESLTANLGSSTSAIYTMTIDSSTLYVGGSFASIGGSSRNSVAAIDLNAGTITSFDPGATSSSPTVYSFLNTTRNLYIAGSFQSMGGETREGLSEVVKATGAATATNFNSNHNVYALALGTDADTLYAGGVFTSIGGQTRNYLAAFSLGAISPGTALSWNPNMQYEVNSLATTSTALYAGGQFTAVGGSPRYYFAKFVDDSPSIQFTSASGSGSESTTTVNIELSLSASYSSNSTVEYSISAGTATGGGVDYTLASGTATVTAGRTTTTIPLTIVNDSTVESDETVLIRIANPTNSRLGTNQIYTYTITNDDSEARSTGGGSVSIATVSSSSRSRTREPGPEQTTQTPEIEPERDTIEEEETELESPEPDEDFPLIPPVSTEQSSRELNEQQRIEAEQRALKQAASSATNYIQNRVTPSKNNQEIVNAIDSFERETNPQAQPIVTVSPPLESADLNKVLSGEVTDAVEMSRIELSVGEKIQSKVEEAFSTISPDSAIDKPERLKVKLSGKTKEINKNTQYKFNFSHEDAEVLRKNYEKENVVVLDPSSDIDGDGISDIIQIDNNLPFFNKDPDEDGFKVSEEIFFGGDPLKPDSFADLVPQKPRITNVDDKEVGSRSLFWVAGQVGDKVDLYIVDTKDKEKKTKIASGEIDGSFKAAIPVDLPDGEYFVFAEGNEGIGELSKIKVNSKLQLDPPELSERPLAAKNHGFIAYAEDFSEDESLIKGYAAKGSKIYVTWKSVTFNSVVIADATSGYFELEIPEELEDGDHEAIAYVIDEKNSWISSINSLAFKKFKST